MSYAYTKEQDEWLIENSDNYPTVEELKNEYNKIFNSNRSLYAISHRIGVLGISRKKTSDAETNWLIDNYDTYSSFTELYQAYVKQFGSAKTYKSIERKIARLRSAHKINHTKRYSQDGYTIEENDWLRDNYNVYENNTKLYEAYTEAFDSNKSRKSIITKVRKIRSEQNTLTSAKKKRYTTAKPRRIRNEFTDAEIEWLRENVDTFESTQGLTDAFNECFNSNRTVMVLYNKVKTLGLKTGRRSNIKYRSFNITDKDPVVAKWLDAQTDPDLSLRILINAYASQHGMNDLFTQMLQQNSNQFHIEPHKNHSQPVSGIANAETDANDDEIQTDIKLEFIKQCLIDTSYYAIYTGRAEPITEPIIASEGKNCRKEYEYSIDTDVLTEALCHIYKKYGNSNQHSISLMDIAHCVNRKLGACCTPYSLVEIGWTATKHDRNANLVTAALDLWINTEFKKELRRAS